MSNRGGSTGGRCGGGRGRGRGRGRGTSREFSSMLVQKRSRPKSPKFSNTRANLDFSPNLHFSTWFSENLYKIVMVVALIATVAALFILWNIGYMADLLCFQTQAAEAIERIQMPQLEEKSIKRVFDKESPYSAFRSEKWVVVSVSEYPTEPLRKLVKIRGWHVLAIGNSKTPSVLGVN